MKKILMLMVSACVHCILFAQTDESRTSAFQLSFIPPLSTNGQLSSQYTNKISLNLLVGISRNESGIAFGGLSNIILDNAKGMQFAGLSNYVGNSGKGMQFAGITNLNKGIFKGMQFAGISNYVGESGKGMQFAGLTNVNKAAFNGIQFAGLSNYVGESGKGMQFAGLTNVDKAAFNGIQFAGLSNYVGESGKGVQFAGLTNINKGSFKGVQFAGLVNTAAQMKDVQIAGLVNIAKDMKGFQFAGLVNVAKKVDGVQFAGLVNVAESGDCPIGLVNIIKNGEKGIGITYDALGSTVVSFRSGGKYTYGILGIGYNHKAESDQIVTEGGLGVHIPCVSWFRINNELKASSIGISSDKPVFNGGYSLLPAFKIGKHAEVFGGAGVHYMATSDVSKDNLFSKKSLWHKYTDTRLQRVYIGYQVGAQYIF